VWPVWQEESGFGVAGLAGVGMTAVSVAAARALESQRPDRLFDDPWAARFVAAAGFADGLPSASAGKDGGRGRWTAAMIPVRTRFLDDFLSAAVGRGCGQVVLLGAGLDTRVFRMDWPAGLRFFEIDTGDVLAFKDAALDGEKPRNAQRIEVRVNMRDDWPAALRASGFRAGIATAWVAEGLMHYLDAGEVHALMTRVASLSAPGSAFATQVSLSSPVQQFIDDDKGLPLIPAETLRPLWKWNGPEDPVSWLAEYGFAARTLPLDECARGYGRDLPSMPISLVSALRH
jgi:methyltransferase (TIGR00027 family)